MAMQQLIRYRWKGNIRELRNQIEKAVLLSENLLLKPIDFTSGSRVQDDPAELDEYNLEKHEMKLIKKALKENGHNKKLTAEKLGINRTTLYNKLRKHGLE